MSDGATPVPVLLRQQVERWAEGWLTAKFSQLLRCVEVIPALSITQSRCFGVAWRGVLLERSLPNAKPKSKRRLRRPTHADDADGIRQVRLAYFRHTDKWFTVYRGLTATECFQTIEENGIFWPPT
jgi:hypothetical protein